MDSPPKKGAVLVVDDEVAICRQVARVLEPQGYDVIQAESGEEAIELFARFGKQIDVVVLDLVMPGIEGEEVFRELREWNGKVRVLVSSGHLGNPALTRLAAYPGTAFLHKPYQPAKLVQAVQNLIEMPAWEMESGSAY